MHPPLLMSALAAAAVAVEVRLSFRGQADGQTDKQNTFHCKTRSINQTHYAYKLSF